MGSLELGQLETGPGGTWGLQGLRLHSKCAGVSGALATAGLGAA